MLVLFETAAGYALFKVLKEGKLEEPDELWKEFETPEAAKETVKLMGFQKFENMNEAVASVNDLLEGKISKDLKKLLKETFDHMEISSEQLAVMDARIGTSISKTFGIQVVSNDTVRELYRGIKQQLDVLIAGIKSDDISQMALGLSHSLSRHRLKFSPDKVDNMIIQAIGLLDDLDKELNTYAMRVKEWYGWHFPEMSKIVVDNLAYSKVVKAMGIRSNSQETDLSEILPEDLEKELKEAAEISMGSEIAEEDIDNIIILCEQVISFTEYRAELYEYLKNRMLAIAPNLTALVGELVGARLIAHSGSLLNLAKHPASTIQILGAEKALFRALKTKSPTPKYGLLYHASLVGQAAPKNKGKAARLLAAKSSLATRVDALSEEKDIQAELGHSNRKYIESRLRFLEGRNVAGVGTNTEKGKGKQKEFKLIPATTSYNSSADVAGPSRSADAGSVGTKRKAEEITAATEGSEEESKESEQDKSDDELKAIKNKKAKKQKLETEQPSKETKAKESKDKKKDKKEKNKNKEKVSEKQDPETGSSKTVAASMKIDEPEAEGSKTSKKRKKAEVKEEKEGSKPEKKVKKAKRSKEASEEKKTEKAVPKEVKAEKKKKKSDKGKQKEKAEVAVEEVEKVEKSKSNKKDKKKDKSDKKTVK